MQDILHWVFVVALWAASITPLMANLVSGHLSGLDLIIAIEGTLTAAITKFVYYATTIQGTTPPTQ